MIDIKRTQLHTFYDIIHKAQVDTSIYLTLDVESYIVYMLMRYLKQSINDQAISIRYMTAIMNNESSSVLVNIADESLIQSGIKKDKYYADVASSAYEYTYMKNNNNIYLALSNNSIMIYKLLSNIF